MPSTSPPVPAVRQAALFVLLASMAFAISGPLARVARPMHPLIIAGGRLAVAALILWMLDLRGIVSTLREVGAREKWTAVRGGILLAGHFALFQAGLDATSLPAAVSLVSLEPLSVVLCAFLMHGVRPNRREWVGVSLATIGAVVVAGGAGSGEHQLKGDLLVLGAVVLYGLYVVTGRKLGASFPPRHYAAVVYGAAAIVVATGLAVFGAPIIRGAWPVPVHAAFAVLGLALIPTILGHTAVQSASRKLSPSVVGLVSPGETLGGILIGAIVLRAVPSAMEMLGALIIVWGAVLAIGDSSDRIDKRSLGATG